MYLLKEVKTQDYKILEEGCKPNSRALTLAKRAKRKHGHGTRRVPKVKT
jgi:hypothetical protein